MKLVIQSVSKEKVAGQGRDFHFDLAFGEDKHLVCIGDFTGDSDARVVAEFHNLVMQYCKKQLEQRWFKADALEILRSLLSKANNTLLNLDDTSSARNKTTFLIAVIEPGTISYISVGDSGLSFWDGEKIRLLDVGDIRQERSAAGHLPRRDAEELTGIFEKQWRKEAFVPGGVLVCFTDGIWRQSMSTDPEDEKTRFAEMINNAVKNRSAAIPLAEDLETQWDGKDDMTAVIIETQATSFDLADQLAKLAKVTEFRKDEAAGIYKDTITRVHALSNSITKAEVEFNNIVESQLNQWSATSSKNLDKWHNVLSDLNQWKTTISESGQSVEQTIKKALEELQDDAGEIKNVISAISDNAKNEMEEASNKLVIDLKASRGFLDKSIESLTRTHDDLVTQTMGKARETGDLISENLLDQYKKSISNVMLAFIAEFEKSLKNLSNDIINDIDKETDVNIIKLQQTAKSYSLTNLKNILVAITEQTDQFASWLKELRSVSYEMITKCPMSNEPQAFDQLNDWEEVTLDQRLCELENKLDAILTYLEEMNRAAWPVQEVAAENVPKKANGRWKSPDNRFGQVAGIGLAVVLILVAVYFGIHNRIVEQSPNVSEPAEAIDTQNPAQPVAGIAESTEKDNFSDTKNGEKGTTEKGTGAGGDADLSQTAKDQSKTLRGKLASEGDADGETKPSRSVDNRLESLFVVYDEEKPGRLIPIRIKKDEIIFKDNLPYDRDERVLGLADLLDMVKAALEDASAENQLNSGNSNEYVINVLEALANVEDEAIDEVTREEVWDLAVFRCMFDSKAILNMGENTDIILDYFWHKMNREFGLSPGYDDKPDFVNPIANVRAKISLDPNKRTIVAEPPQSEQFEIKRKAFLQYMGAYGNREEVRIDLDLGPKSKEALRKYLGKHKMAEADIDTITDAMDNFQ